MHGVRAQGLDVKASVGGGLWCACFQLCVGKSDAGSDLGYNTLIIWVILFCPHPIPLVLCALSTLQVGT